MELNKKTPKKYLIIAMIAPYFLFVFGLTIESGDGLIFYAIMFLPLYLIYFVIPVSVLLLVVYVYKKLRVKS